MSVSRRRSPGLGNRRQSGGAAASATAARDTGPAPSSSGVLASLRNVRADEAFTPATETGAEEIKLAKLAPHPANPRTIYLNLDSLSESLKEFGQMQAVLAVERDQFLEENPEHADALAKDYPEAEYVVLEGSRRYYAAADGGLEALDAVVRDRYKTKEHAVLVPLITGSQREPLPPVDEARQLKVALELGYSQRDLARITPYKQSHISKRLKLLKLSYVLQVGVNKRDIDINDGYKIAEIGDHLYGTDYDSVDEQRTTVWELQEQAASLVLEHGWTATAAVKHVTREHSQLDEPADEPIETPSSNDVDDQGPEDGLGESAAVETTSEHDSADGGDAAAPKPTKPTKPTEKKTKPKKTTRTAREDKTADPLNSAAQRREEICREIVAKKPTASDAEDLLSAFVLAGGDYPHTEARSLAYQWLHDHGIAQETDPAAWEQSVRHNPDSKPRRHAAVAYAWAANEIRTRRSPSTWSDAVVEYLDRLERDHGYQLSDDEQQGRDKARSRANV